MSFRRSSYLCFALRLLFARCFDSGSAASLFLKKTCPSSLTALIEARR